MPPATSPPHQGDGLSPSEDEIREAIAFRKLYGLPAEESWVRAVATNPASRAALDFNGVPLLPSEFADLQHRRFDRAVLDEIRRYGSLFPGEFAGAFFESSINGVKVAFTGRVERHRQALLNLLPEDVNIQVREAPWSSAELEQFATDVRADEPWFASAGLLFGTAGRRVTEDFVYVQYEGPPEAAQAVLDHFGNPPWLKVEWQGPLPWSGPRADLAVTAHDASGRPVSDLECAIVPRDSRVRGFADSVNRTDAKGRCTFHDIPAVAYRLTLYDRVGDAGKKKVGEVDTTLLDGGGVVQVAVRDGS
jgi:hypothetical protein